MIFIGIYVAKNKHDCFITHSAREVLQEGFTIQNSMIGFQ